MSIAMQAVYSIEFGILALTLCIIVQLHQIENIKSIFDIYYKIPMSYCD